MSRAERHVPWIVLVGAAILAMLAFNLWWVARYRQGYPLTIDEAGYISIALVDHLGLQNGGLHGWWEAIRTQVPQAPLVPALTSLVVGIKPGTQAAFAVLAGFAALLAFAAYAIGARLAGPRLGALAALIVACAPGTFAFAREYVFALPAAAMLSCCVYALLRSDGLRSRAWALLCGVGIGLMLLTRTMAIAYVPGLLLAATAAICVRGWLGPDGRDQLGRRLVNLVLMVVAAVAVALTWYGRNFKPVYDYLTGYGYGSDAADYGPAHSWLSWEKWRDVANRMTYVDLLLPLGVLILLGVVTLAVLAYRRLRVAPDRRPVLLQMLGSDAVSVAIVFVAGYLALTSSRNGGEGFTLPLAVLLPPLAVIALRHLRRPVAMAALVALGLVITVNVASNTNLSDSLSRMRLVSVPGFDPVPWINGTPHGVSALRPQDPGPATEFVAADRGWPEADKKLAEMIASASGAGRAHEPIAFASRSTMINTSTLELAGLFTFQHPFFLIQMTADSGDTVANYKRQLTAPIYGVPGVLITMSSNAGDYPPTIDQHRAEVAARRVGFDKLGTMPLPDGRLMRVWGRPYAE